MIREAKFSECGKHRYSLTRIWDESKPKVMFIGLNPSTADAEKDDPTIRKVIKFAKLWGFGSVVMVNCYSFITAYPNKLKVDKLHQYNNFTEIYIESFDSKKNNFCLGKFRNC